MADPADILAFRFGYGLPHGAERPDTAQDRLVRLAQADAGLALWPALPEAGVFARMDAAVAMRKALRERPKDEDLRKTYQQALRGITQEAGQMQRRVFARALDSPDGLRERLCWFWADHFTTVSRGRTGEGLPGIMADHAIRPHVTGRFVDMLRAAALHPAMLAYLDQGASVGPNSKVGRKGGGLNENLARELIELHTLGVGSGYAQADVRQLAELLTGVVYAPGKGMVFRPQRAEPGAEQVLGRSYDGPGLAPIHAVLDDLAHRPETAEHLARKLAVHFLQDDPDPALVRRMAQVYLAEDTGLMPVYAELLQSPAAQAAPMRKARQPVEFIIAGLRALGVPGAALVDMSPKLFNRVISAPLALMAQPFGAPRGPDGWPEPLADWVTPQGLAGRIAWAMAAPGVLLGDALPDPRRFAQQALGSLAGPALLTAVARSESVAEGVGLVLAAPEFNRR